MKLVLIMTVMTMVLVVILPAILGLGMKNMPVNNQPPLLTTQKIYSLNKASQEITIRRENLSGIGVSLKNPNLVNKKDITLSIYNDKNDLLRSVSINGNRISDGGLVKFNFEPIGYIAADLSFTLSAPIASEPEALEVFLDNEGQVSYISFYQPISLTLIKDIYINWFNRFAADTVFAVIYFITIFSTLGYLAKEVLGSRRLF